MNSDILKTVMSLHMSYNIHSICVIWYMHRSITSLIWPSTQILIIVFYVTVTRSVSYKPNKHSGYSIHLFWQYFFKQIFIVTFFAFVVTLFLFCFYRVVWQHSMTSLFLKAKIKMICTLFFVFIYKDCIYMTTFFVDLKITYFILRMLPHVKNQVLGHLCLDVQLNLC